MPNLHRRYFQRGTPFMLSKGALPPEKAFIRAGNKTPVKVAVQNWKLQ